MTTMLLVILVSLTSVFVFAAGWRMCPPKNAMAGGFGALLLFLLHPSILTGVQSSSPWDAFFVMFFVCSWLWMENWSMFMRSWVLAGIYAFGLWVGSPFILWGLVAMVPWIIFNRRPLPAVGSMLTVFLGGIFFFALSWGLAYLLVPNIGRPLFTQWIRWGVPKLPPTISLPWCLLVLAAVIDRFQEMMNDRRADATIFGAMLLIVIGLMGSSLLNLAMIALSAPLIMRILAKREFLFHRGVRWVAALSCVLSLALMYGLGKEAWAATGVAIVVVGLSSRRFYGAARLPWSLAGQAACVGAYLADSLGILLQIFPK